jgi:hypothetical protein
MKLRFEAYNKYGAMFAFFLSGADALTRAKGYKRGFVADGCRQV